MRVELLLGWRPKQARRLERVLDESWGLFPTDDTWTRVQEWAAEAVQAGQRFGVADLLIAAVAREHEMPVWSLDQDFRRMEGLGFVDCYDP